MSDFLDVGAKMETGYLQSPPAPRKYTRLEKYEEQRILHMQQIALLDEAIAALKSNTELERIINLLDRL